MLRVLTLSTLFPDAGRSNFGVFVERQTAALAAREGVAVTVVAPIGMPPGPLARIGRFARTGALPERETWKGLTVERPRFRAIPGIGGRRHVAGLTRALIPVLDRLHDERGFDVIDASFFFPDGPAAVTLGRRYGVPVSIKARGADIHYWGTARGTRGAVLAAGLGADGLLAVSEAMKADMIALGMAGEAITVHRTGIDRSRFHPLDRGAAKAALGVKGALVVSTGALIARKGHDVVIGAVAKLPGVTLMIAGQGPERQALEALVRKRGVAGRTRFLGSIPHDNLARWVGAADVMALASASEGLANAWVEALACGTPIVVTGAGGAAEVVTSPAAGRIAARNPDAFAAAIGDLLANPSAPATVAKAVADFSWERNAETLHAHLDGLVARRRGGMPGGF